MKFSSNAEMIGYFVKSMTEIQEAQKKVNAMVDKYKAETKAVFGISDGEQLNLIQIAAMVTKILDNRSNHASFEIEGAAV